MNILSKKAIRHLFPIFPLNSSISRSHWSKHFLKYADLVFSSLDQTCRGIVRLRRRKFLNDSFVYLHFIRCNHYAVTVIWQLTNPKALRLKFAPNYERFVIRNSSKFTDLYLYRNEIYIRMNIFVEFAFIVYYSYQFASARSIFFL